MNRGLREDMALLNVILPAVCLIQVSIFAHSCHLLNYQAD